MVVLDHDVKPGGPSFIIPHIKIELLVIYGLTDMACLVEPRSFLSLWEEERFQENQRRKEESGEDLAYETQWLNRHLESNSITKGYSNHLGDSNSITLCEIKTY